MTDPTAFRSTAAEDELLRYLRMVAEAVGRPASRTWRHPSHYHLLLAYGRFHEPADLAPGIPRLEPAKCYPNAGRTAREQQGLMYAEGITMIAAGKGFVPVDHGWCTASGGRVADPTLDDGVGVAYFGITLTNYGMWPSPTGWHVLPNAYDLMQTGPAPGMFAEIGRLAPYSKEN
ncbi:hypothetical protein ACFVGM_09275 [Kitasatospora purpeofusca]|uniref:hypothetical protein n=1 Tax=Kitasatospora purpeofusca TaxID=67352 RepID=UPI0036BE8456